MLTQEEKDFLLKLLNNVQVTGNRQQARANADKIDQLVKKIEQMPVETPEAPAETMAARLKKDSRYGSAMIGGEIY